MTPQHRHAIANLWSLRAVWPALSEAAQRATGALGDDLGTVQAWRPGSGAHSGPYGDALLDAVITRGRGASTNPYAERIARTGETIDWLAAQLLPPSPATIGEALRELTAAVTDLRPAVALNLALHVSTEDRAVRRLLGERDDHVRLPRLACPYCRTPGALAIRFSNPVMADRPVVCDAGCTCDGPGCPCGTGAAVQGLPHIWTGDQLSAALDRGQSAA